MPLTAVVARRRPWRCPSANRNAATLSTPGHVLDARRTTLAEIGEKPSWFCTIIAACICSSIVLSIEALQAGGEDRHEHDERQADHQRRGGDRGALRLADRVLARQLAGQALEARQRRAEHARQRAHQQRRQERDAEHHQHRAEAEQRRPPRSRSRSRRAGRTGTRSGRRAISASEPTIRRVRRCPMPGRDAVAHRRHRLDAGRAAGRDEARRPSSPPGR